MPPLPTGIGNVIMEHFALPPSRQIGDLKRALEVAVESGELESQREAEYYLAHVAKLLGRVAGARGAAVERVIPARNLAADRRLYGARLSTDSL